MDTAGSSFSPKEVYNERNINSQPGIARKNYSLNNYNSLNKKKDTFFERKQHESLQNSARNRQYTPSTKIGSEFYRKERTISYNNDSINNSSLGQTIHHKYDTLNVNSTKR